MRLQTEHDPGDVTTSEGWGAADVPLPTRMEGTKDTPAYKALTNCSFVSSEGKK